MSDIETKEVKRSSILIVDDGPKNIMLLNKILGKENYETFAASDGKSALEIAESNQPDLILLDVMMPEIDGFETCEKLKASEKTKDIPVIFLTAKSDTKDIVKGFQLGAVDYVLKPFNAEELVARVRMHVKFKKAEREIVRLEQKNTIMAMAVTANHEINQPLTVLQGNFDLYRSSRSDDELTEKQKKNFEKIDESIEKISVILKKFIQFKSAHLKEYSKETDMVVFDTPKSNEL
ncbi:MAG: response regulator [bacterium]|nr:response regulator [bacterium]